MTDRITMRRRLRMRSHVRSVTVYSLLVGLPFVGLLLVLERGQRLEAPPSVDGTWRVESGSTCGLGPGDTFEIVQSGRFVVVSLAGRPPLEGRLSVGALRARGGAREASAPGCGEGQLELVLRLAGDSRRMAGTGGIVGCSACPPRPISAARWGAD